MTPQVMICWRGTHERNLRGYGVLGFKVWRSGRVELELRNLRLEWEATRRWAGYRVVLEAGEGLPPGVGLASVALEAAQGLQGLLAK